MIFPPRALPLGFFLTKSIVIFRICATINKRMSYMLYDSVIGGIPMAESKQYITQVQDNGSLMISEDVIADIANFILEN